MITYVYFYALQSIRCHNIKLHTVGCQIEIILIDFPQNLWKFGDITYKILKFPKIKPETEPCVTLLTFGMSTYQNVCIY